MLKRHILLVSIFYAIALTLLSFINIGAMELQAPSQSDKVFHFLSYTILTILWAISFNHKFKFSTKRALWTAAFSAIIFGTVIEVLQGIVTTTRATDFYDFIANTLGIVTGVVLMSLYFKRYIKK